MKKEFTQQSCCAGGSEYSTGLRRVIQLKIVNAVLATVFLLTGLLYKEFFPDQLQVGDLLILAAAISVFVPIMINGIKGFFVAGNQYMTEQLVMFASIALIVNGELAAATIIPIIMVIGHLLEEKSIIGVEEAISSLKKLSTNKAHLLVDGQEKESDIKSLEIDQQVIVYPGEIVPIDGRIKSGQSLINQAHVTGESAPLEVAPGAELFAGTTNLTGKLVVQVTRTAGNTLLSNIVSLLKEAGNTKIPIVKIIEKYLDLYFPAVIMIAAITLFVTHDIERLVTVLVISCPCAFVLASPTAMIAALVVASRKGIMIRNSAFVESLANVDTMIFDKTGTVTTGYYQIVELLPEAGISESELITAAGLCATGSMHPVSQAINRYCVDNAIELHKAETQKELHGKGVEARHNGNNYYLGKAEWLNSLPGLKAQPSDNNSLSTVWVAANDRLLGSFSLADLPRPEFKEIINECRAENINEIVLLTGDKQAVGERIGKLFAFDLIKSECLPKDKLDFVQECKTQGKKVLFVGDGINDALALKASDVGVAIGVGGSDIAIQSSDITLKSESLASIPFMFRLSRRIHRTINQNILIGTGFSLLMIILATLGFITPIWGAVSHNLGTLFVLINSASLLSKRNNLN